MDEQDADIFILGAVDEVCWLFNLRGYDYPMNLGFFSYVIVGKTSVYLFLAVDKLSLQATESLKGVMLRPYYTFESELVAICSANHDPSRKVWLQRKLNFAVSRLVTSSFPDSVMHQMSPIPGLKTVKNSTELAGMRKAHIKEAVVICEYIYWLYECFATGVPITEATTLRKLEGLRQQQSGYLGNSFPPISSSGTNSAMPFYGPHPEKCRVLCADDLYLVDTGAHYYDGTTDVCRMIAFTEPNPEHKRIYTHILTSIIRTCSTPITPLVTAYDLALICGAHLAKEGLTCPHAIGHGVGHTLNVVEGPINYHAPYSAPFEPGMCCTLEPGVFISDKFGIRLENLYIVTKTTGPGAKESQMHLEDIAFVPIDRRFLDLDKLEASDIAWIDNYHKKVNRIVGCELIRQGKPLVADWLARETMALQT